MRPLPPLEYLGECVDFDAKAGTFIWKRRPPTHFCNLNAYGTWNSRWAGKPAFATINNSGYPAGMLDGTGYLAHRVVWKFLTGRDPAAEIDHIDGNPSNNKPSNLRSVSRSANMRNARLRTDNNSGVQGVHWDKGRRRWGVSIGNKTIGRFQSLDDAIAARKRAEKEEGGFHPNHGRAA